MFVRHGIPWVVNIINHNLQVLNFKKLPQRTDWNMWPGAPTIQNHMDFWKLWGLSRFYSEMLTMGKIHYRDIFFIIWKVPTQASSGKKHTNTAFHDRFIEAQKDFVVLSKIFQVTQTQRDIIRELCLFVSVPE